MKTRKGKILVITFLIIAFGAYIYYDLFGKTAINGTLLIDNPTNEILKVTIDKNRWEIQPHKWQEITLEKGEHNIAGIGKFTIDEISYGVINPTRSKYITYNFVYSANPESQDFKPYQVDGKEIYCAGGEPQVSSDLFIPDVTLGNGNIDDEVPSTQDLNHFNSNGQRVFVKLFRMNDFLEYYKTHQ